MTVAVIIDAAINSGVVDSIPIEWDCRSVPRRKISGDPSAWPITAMRTDMERREAGEKIIREMMGEETAGQLLASAGSGTFGSAVAGYAIAN